MPGLLDFLGLGNNLTQFGGDLLQGAPGGTGAPGAPGATPSLLTLLNAAGSRPMAGDVAAPPSPFGALQPFSAGQNQTAPQTPALAQQSQPLALPRMLGAPMPDFSPKPQGFPAPQASAAAPAPAATDDDDDKPAVAAKPAAGIGLPSAGAPMDIRPAAQTSAAPKSPGVLDTISQVLDSLGNVYGRGGPFDGLINLGVGMSSGPGGMQRALQMTQQGQQASQSSALQLAKFMRETQGQQELIPLVKAKMTAANGGVAPTDAAVAAVLNNPSSMAAITAQLIKTPEQEKAEKSQLVTVKQADGSEQQQWMVPGQGTGTPVGAPVQPKQPDAVRDLQYAQQNWKAMGLPDPSDQKNAPWWQDFSRQRLAGGGVSVSLPPLEKASDQAFGKAEGDHFGAILKAGDDARQMQGQLQFMSDAFQNGGSNITTGPAAKAVLAGKQLVQGLTGIDLGGVPESEAVNKLGFGLATSLVQDISKRGGTQAEFIRGLQNVPGIFMSQAGSRVMMNVLNQQAQAKIDLGQLVQDPESRKNWSKTVDGYYASHPLISPFTGKPLSAADLNTLRAAAREQGIDPATGQPAAGSASSAQPASLGWSFTPEN